MAGFDQSGAGELLFGEPMAVANSFERDALGRVDVLRRERDRFVALAFCAADMLVETDAEERITFAAGATRALTGNEPERLIGQRLTELVAPDDRVYVAELLAGMVVLGRFDAVMAHLVGPDGVTPPLLLSGHHVADMPGRYFFALKVGAAAIDPEIANSLTRDRQSGLLDRESFLMVAERQAKRAHKTGENLKLTLLRMQNLPELRARLDSESNQRLASTIGAYLRAGAAGGDGAGQLDDSNYGLIHRQQVDIERLRAKIEASALAVDPQGEGVTVKSGTIDADVAAMTDADALRVLRYALDRFCEDDKRAPPFDSLSHGLEHLLDHTAQRVAELRRIIAGGNFEVVFQPIVEVALGRIHHFEALARFPAAAGRDASPYSTIVFAEATGLITDFDLAMCRRVLEWLAEHAQGRDSPIVAVNISGRSVNDLPFRDSLLDLLAAFPAERGRVIFEITESVRIPDLVLANQFIRGLRRAGHKVCLDDFGAGSAALEYLRRLEVDIVKIDGQYLRSAVDDAKSKVFLKAMAALCHELEIDMIGEMVEDERYLALLEECGIRFAQGYHYGRPHADLHSFLQPQPPKRMGIRRFTARR